jgi:hypothetical protein
MSENYCACCYAAAAKAGRTVRLTDVYEYPVCSLCESRLRNGLIHYVPSNGSEGDMFASQCNRCRHFDPASDEDYTVKQCAWGIRDKVTAMMWEDSDSAKAWHDPADLDDQYCPASCRRFTSKDDENGHFRDPPPPDVTGQMTFGEVDMPVERSPDIELARSLTSPR